MNDWLFDEAKLTDEELDALENEHLLWDDDSTRPIADAATAKALRVVLERVRGVAVAEFYPGTGPASPTHWRYCLLCCYVWPDDMEPRHDSMCLLTQDANAGAGQVELPPPSRKESL